MLRVVVCALGCGTRAPSDLQSESRQRNTSQQGDGIVVMTSQRSTPWHRHQATPPARQPNSNNKDDEDNGNKDNGKHDTTRHDSHLSRHLFHTHISQASNQAINQSINQSINHGQQSGITACPGSNRVGQESPRGRMRRASGKAATSPSETTTAATTTTTTTTAAQYFRNRDDTPAAMGGRPQQGKAGTRTCYTGL